MSSSGFSKSRLIFLQNTKNMVKMSSPEPVISKTEKCKWVKNTLHIQTLQICEYQMT